MIRRIVARCRGVAPPVWTVVVLILLFGISSIPQVVFGQQPAKGGDPPARLYLIVGSIMLGIYRAAAFHPYFLPSYLRWLKLTPWTVNKPLPLGPVELIPEDSLWVGLIILLGASHSQPRSIELLNIFLFSHVLVLIVTFWRTGGIGFGYIAVMLLGFMPLLWTRPWLNFVLLTGIYLFVHEGLWRALKRFPWETEGILVDLGMIKTTETHPPCGWFFDRFHRDITTAKGISRLDAFLGCMLGSWWLFVLASLFPDPTARFAVPFLCTVGAMTFCPLYRLLIYCQGCRWPISVWGRIGTFRLVIPGYDQILVGPVCSLLPGPMALLFYLNYPIPGEICFSVSAGLTVLVALITPPWLRRWRLTGQHRLAPTFAEMQAASVHKMGQP
jgi:hypothetical protein